MSFPEYPNDVKGLGLSSPGTSDISSTNHEANYHVTQIPVLLYEDISRHLTLGEEREVHSLYKKYQVRELDPNHKYTGFSGAIGIKKNEYHTRFVLWFSVPNGVDNSVFEPSPILEIDTGPIRTGVWSFGLGDHMAEHILATLPHGAPLTSPAIRLISLILYRASELARNPRCIMDSFWQSERPDAW